MKKNNELKENKSLVITGAITGVIIDLIILVALMIVIGHVLYVNFGLIIGNEVYILISLYLFGMLTLGFLVIALKLLKIKKIKQDLKSGISPVE